MFMEDDLKALLSEKVDIGKNLRDLAERFDKLLASYRCNLDFQIIICPQDLSSLLLEEMDTTNLTLLRESGDASLFRVHRKRRMKEYPLELEGDFIVKRTPKEGIYLILAFVPGDLWRHGVLWVLKKLKRKIAFPLLTQKEFKEAISTIGARYEDSEVFVRYVASKPKTLVRKPKKLYPLTRQDGEQEGVTLNEAFETILEDERRITSLRFKVKQSFRTICSGTVTPKCQFICKRGASLFSETALTKMINYAFQKFELIRGRSRKLHPNYKVTPITLRYETEAFPDLETGKQFIDSMRKMGNSSCTVIHGNPYIHLSIADYSDGSSYRILVLDPKEITIVPQLKASEGSLQRLINHIFEGFKEGEVVEVKSGVV